MNNKDIHNQCTAAIQGLCLDVRELREERYRMERQLAAVERMYFAATECLGWLVAQEWEVSMSAIVALEKALDDYANAKGEK